MLQVTGEVKRPPAVQVTDTADCTTVGKVVGVQLTVICAQTWPQAEIARTIGWATR
jgi:hypothetical protein